jgi:putative membrane protein
MTTSLLLDYSHLFFAALAFAGPVFALVLLHRPWDLATAQRLRQGDLTNGIAATVVLLIGLLRLFYYGKGSDYYFHNLPFVIKLVLYGVATGLSLVSTLEVRRWAPALGRGNLPVLGDIKRGQMRTALVLQVVCVVGMAACAVLAAKGFGA